MMYNGKLVIQFENVILKKKYIFIFRILIRYLGIRIILNSEVFSNFYLFIYELQMYNKMGKFSKKINFISRTFVKLYIYFILFYKFIPSKYVSFSKIFVFIKITH